eukprot:gene26761-4338_t
MHGLSARNLLEAALATVVWISSLNLAHPHIVEPSGPSCSSSTKACLAARETALESLGSILVPTESRMLVEPLSVMFTNNTGIVLSLSYVPFHQLTAEMVYNLNHNTSQLFDAFCFSPPGLVDIDYAKGFLELTPFVSSDPQLKKMNGTVLEEGRQPSAAVCLVLGNGASSYVVELLMAPVFSYAGRDKGFVIDPVTMDPLVGSKGWEKGLGIELVTMDPLVGSKGRGRGEGARV